MARRVNYTTRNANRALARIQEAAEDKSQEIARAIVEAIHINAPEGSALRGTEHDDPGPPLSESFYARQDPVTGDYLIGSRRRYWAYVEFGTRRVDPHFSDAQPYIRPAIDAVKRYYS